MHRHYQSLFSNIRIYWQVYWPSVDDWDPPPLHFNLSHTSSLIACGVTVNSQVSSLTILSLSFYHIRHSIDFCSCLLLCCSLIKVICTHLQIGIDVEEKHRSTKHSILSFARRYFSEYEVEVLAAISDPQIQQREFIKLWTLKVWPCHSIT